MHLPPVTSVAVSDPGSSIFMFAGCALIFAFFSSVAILQLASGTELSLSWIFFGSTLKLFSGLSAEIGAEVSFNCFVEKDSLDCRLTDFLLPDCPTKELRLHY